MSLLLVQRILLTIALVGVLAAAYHEFSWFVSRIRQAKRSDYE